MSALSKRQQARNERALQELIRSVPGNDRCVDCQARNPGWASWNLGVFLCMRCAALHRKLGTHISKVKSLSMDSWSSDQVDNMKRNGNVVVNKIYNPRNVKPPIPIDVDEADSAMERFIRQKYELKVLEDGRPKPPSRHDPSYTSSSKTPLPGDGGSPPPPLPPKTGRRFGFGLRPVSSTNTFSSSEQSSPRDEYGLSSNKQSRVFGASIGDTSGSFESKLEALRDMGFPDSKRNATILRGLNGNLEKAIESLVRLGEGTDRRPRARTPVPRATPTSSQFSEPAKSPKSTVSNNPFDNLDFAPPRTAVSQAGSQSEPQSAVGNGDGFGAPAKSYNPFDSLVSQPASMQSTLSLDQSFQQLQVSQPLFPNITGGYPSQQGQMPFQRYQQSMTPPVTMSSQNGIAASPSSVNGGYNPFFQNNNTQSVQPQQQAQVQNNPYFSQAQSLSPTNPFFNVPGGQPQSVAQQRPHIPDSSQSYGNNQPQMPSFQRYNTMPTLASSSPFSQQQPQSQQPQQPQQQYMPQQQQQEAAYNPFSMPTTNPTTTPSSYQLPLNLQQQQPQQHQQQPLIPQPTGKFDKSAILALYNFSQPPPTIPEQPPPMPQQQQQQQQQQDFMTPAHSQPQPPQPHLPTNPLNITTNTPLNTTTTGTGTRNPYFTTPTQTTTHPLLADPSSSSSSSTLPSNNISTPLSAPVMGAKAQIGGVAGGGGGNPFPQPHTHTHAHTHTHMSRESVDIAGLQSGRHSPDVFASLSARYVR
ncbi:hypothetical protein FQN51_000341 [Onygenales sp. PD_10]|nr:hypothetical protein FQN51_000341 [Onygenales sp. PD_10]